MKIIKHGTPPKDKVYKFSCKKCGTIFECLGQEVKKDISGSYRGESFNEYNCPVCMERCFNYDD